MTSAPGETRLYDFRATTLAGSEYSLDDYRGKVVLVVNTASKCGFAPQFTGLQQLYTDFADAGFVVLGFPSDQFRQEYDDVAKIEQVCRVDYGVTFPMHARIEVNGRRAHPLFQWLRNESGSGLANAIKWNFTKFLVDRDGRFVRRYAPKVEPAVIEPDIRALLAADPRPRP